MWHVDVSLRLLEAELGLEKGVARARRGVEGFRACPQPMPGEGTGGPEGCSRAPTPAAGRGIAGRLSPSLPWRPRDCALHMAQVLPLAWRPLMLGAGGLGNEPKAAPGSTLVGMGWREELMLETALRGVVSSGGPTSRR